MEPLTPIKVFEHCRLILGMVLSLAVARLLNGFARFVQHPTRHKIFLPHILWAFAILLHLTHFWWWEFALARFVTQWTFEIYALLLLYAISIFFLACLLFPDDIQDYSGYEEYFMSRRAWFFTMFAATISIDFVDTLLKGATYFQSLGPEYPIRNAAYLVLCAVAVWSKSTRVQFWLAAVSLAYEVSYILRLYHTMR
jgi:hypothetical protein